MRCFFGGLFLLGAVMSIPTPAWAQAPVPQAEMAAPATPTAAYPRTVFFGVNGGVGFVNAAHPQLGDGSFVGPLLGLHVGYQFLPSLAVSLQMTDISARISRLSAGSRFDSTSSWMGAQFFCRDCTTPPGADVLATDIHLTTVAPRVDFAPFGMFGPYLAVSGGLAFMHGVEARVGGEGTASLGLRLRPTKGSSLRLEGGAQGQAYGAGTSAAMYFAALSGDLHL